MLLQKKRILVQDYNNDKIETYSIPFEDIGRVNVATNIFDSKKGDLFILIKNAKKKKYQVYDMAPENYGKVPTILQIHNPQEVAKLIRQGIKF